MLNQAKNTNTSHRLNISDVYMDAMNPVIPCLLNTINAAPLDTLTHKTHINIYLNVQCEAWKCRKRKNERNDSNGNREKYEK